jgi:fibronectin-binding autotransporter adhesin
MTFIHIRATQIRFFSTLAILASAHANASVCTWTGASSSVWSAAANWTSCAGNAPVNGDSLLFPENALNKTNVNTISTLTQVEGISFTGTTSGYALSGSPLAIGAGGISVQSTSGSNSIANSLSLSAAQSFAGNFGATSLNGTLNLNGQTLKITWPGLATTPQWTVNGVISGNGAIEVTGVNGASGLQFFGNNTFSGPVTLKAGRTVIGHNNALGLADGSAQNGTNIFSGGLLSIAPFIAVGNEGLILAAGVGPNGNGMIQYSGPSAWGGPVSLPGAGFSRVVSVAANGVLDFNGIISGIGGFEFGASPGVVAKLSNSGNMFSGGVTTMNASPTQGVTIRLGGDNALPAGSNVVLKGNSTLDLNGFDATLNDLTCVATDGVLLGIGSALTVGSGGASSTCAGNISGLPSSSPFTVLNKIGVGIFTVAADNNYSGEVDVLGGGLDVEGTLSTDLTSAIYVSGGAQNATVFGNGSVNKIISAGNVHAGSASAPGTLFGGLLALNSTGNVSARILSDSNFDRLNVSNLTLAPGAALNVSLSYQPLPGTVFKIIDNSGDPIIGAFTGLNESGLLSNNGIVLRISYVGGTGNDVTLTTIGPDALFANGFE